MPTPAYQAFGYKQLILEPFFGGGLVTAGAIPVIANFGAGALFAGMLALFLGALAAGLLYFGRRRTPTPASEPVSTRTGTAGESRRGAGA